MPMVDVIVPAYNAARYLSVAIESVRAQTFEDWRIVLVNDGSTDDTAAIASRYAGQLGAKLKYVEQPNQGLPAARNAAIRNSSAEYLALLDADDVWLPQRLEASLQCFENRPAVGLSYGFIAWIDAQGKILRTFAERQKHGEGKIAPYIYMRSVHLPCPTITFRRKCVEEVGLFDESLRATEDRDLWLRIALRYEVALVPSLLAHYRTSAGSMSSDPERMLQAQLRFIGKHYGAAGCGRMARRIALSRSYQQYAEALGSRRRMGSALWSCLRAVALYPADLSAARTAASVVLRCAGLSA